MSTYPLPITVEDIARDTLSHTSDDDKAFLLNIERDDMIQFHHGVGTDIRNNYNLWIDHPLTEQYRRDYEADNKEYIINGVDHHPQHPDAVSMDILYAIWDLIHTS